jgi:hypothetical protein
MTDVSTAVFTTIPNAAFRPHHSPDDLSLTHPRAQDKATPVAPRTALRAALNSLPIRSEPSLDVSPSPAAPAAVDATKDKISEAECLAAIEEALSFRDGSKKKAMTAIFIALAKLEPGTGDTETAPSTLRVLHDCMIDWVFMGRWPEENYLAYFPADDANLETCKQVMRLHGACLLGRFKRFKAKADRKISLEEASKIEKDYRKMARSQLLSHGFGLNDYYQHRIYYKKTFFGVVTNKNGERVENPVFTMEKQVWMSPLAVALLSPETSAADMAVLMKSGARLDAEDPRGKTPRAYLQRLLHGAARDELACRRQQLETKESRDEVDCSPTRNNWKRLFRIAITALSFDASRSDEPDELDNILTLTEAMRILRESVPAAG